MDERVKAFLQEVAEVSRKHGLYLDSCGDCGSMWVEDVETYETLADQIGWDKELRSYSPPLAQS